MKKIWSEPVFLKNMNDYLIFWSYFIMLRFFSRMGYWDEIYENTLSCIECLRSSVGICPLLYLTLPYCINSETAPPLFVDRPQTCPSGSVTTWEGQPWKCTRSTCPRPSMAWHSLKLPSKSLSRCLSPSFFFFSLSLSISKQRYLPFGHYDGGPLLKSDVLIPCWNFIVAEYILKKDQAPGP